MEGKAMEENKDKRKLIEIISSRTYPPLSMKRKAKVRLGERENVMESHSK